MDTFDYGEQVRVTKNIRNDGSVMGADRGDLLVRRGSIGHVKGIGKFLQDQIIYQVHFMDQGFTIGCRDTEVCGVDEPWIERVFERGDRVSVQQALGSGGEVVVETGEIGIILGIENKTPPLSYRVSFERTEGQTSNTWVIPERVLTMKLAAPMVLGKD